MKANGSIAPSASFIVTKSGDSALIVFYENAAGNTVQGEDGQSRTDWSWDEYRMVRPWRESLEDDIEAAYDSWLQTAKVEDEARTPVDAHQLRADVDYLEIMSVAMSPYGVSMMSGLSDPDVLEKARRYYPARWSKERLLTLVHVQKLSEEDYQSMTGEAIGA